MNKDCHWFESNLEAYFSDALNGENVRLAREHLEGCGACSQKVQGLQDIDPLLRQLMRFRLAQAHASADHRPQRRVLRPAFLLTAIAVVLVGAFGLRDRSTSSVPPPIIAAQPAIPESSPSPEVPEKKADDLPVKRAKPDDSAAALNPIPGPGGDNPIPGGSDFAVIDAAGYSSTLDNYRGFVLIVGVWSADQTESTENLNRIYETFGHKPQVRVLGVAAHRQDKIGSATFPVVFNRGSQLMGLKAGEFLLLDKSGNRRLSGSLVTGTNTVLPRIKTQLDQLGVK